uniref:Vacuolar protein sorting-associated protein 41 homolog n=1 Tax=Cacopsylla melanoneura TaxID=428564 RepID=A0A8D8Q5T3_9HEMI
MGTEWGRVHLLDHQGNSIKNQPLHHHSVYVSSISIDLSGEYIASCSHDGKVYVYGLCSANDDMNVNLQTLLTSVQINPHYKKSSKRFVTGDSKLILHEKTILSRVRSTTLCDASMEGGVINMSWASQFIAWATNVGMRVYDIQARTSLGLIKWRRNTSISPDQVKCSLVWAADERSLLVGWMSTICVCIVRKRNASELPSRDLPEHIVEQVAFIQTDYIVCGLGPLSPEELVVLGYYPHDPESEDPERPQILVYETSSKQIISTDSLTLRGYEQYTAKDYQLVCLIEETRFTIVSPKDIVVANPYDADDRVEWLIDHNKFEEAMEAVIAKEKYLQRNSMLDVGRKYLDHLLFMQEYELAGEVCKKVLGTNKTLWEEEVYKFARVHELRKISRHLPQGHYKLDPHIYEMVLFEYLQLEPEGFLDLVKEWPPDLYKVSAIINAVLEHMIKSDMADKDIVLEALAILYSHSHKYDKALALYLKLKHRGVFEMIQKHDLYNVVHDMIEQLMDLDLEQSIAMLTEKDKGENVIVTKLKIPSNVVVTKLEHNPMYLYLYLDAQEKQEGIKKYHGILVRLYAEYCRDNLLPLLKRSDTYPIREALNICKTNNYIPEMVYLLGRIGNTKEALSLIMSELKDIQQAITFCQEHDDTDLWQDLINYALAKPEYITYLLQRIGMFVDPRILVERIQDRMEIAGLKYSLVKMMRDYNLQVSVQEGCKKILVSDFFNLQERLVSLQSRGIVVDSSSVCAWCDQQLMSSQLVSRIITFNCKHSYHELCLPTYNMEKCRICSTERLPEPRSLL